MLIFFSKSGTKVKRLKTELVRNSVFHCILIFSITFDLFQYKSTFSVQAGQYLIDLVATINLDSKNLDLNFD